MENIIWGLPFGGVAAGVLTAFMVQRQKSAALLGHPLLAFFVSAGVLPVVDGKTGSFSEAAYWWFGFGAYFVPVVGLTLLLALRRGREFRAQAEKFQRRMQSLQGRLEKLKREYAFVLISQPKDGALWAHTLSMNAAGDTLRFLDLTTQNGVVESLKDVVVPMEKVRSVEFIRHESVATEYEGASRASRGLTRAAVGGAIFGGAGAVVGATTANRRNTATSRERVLSSRGELVFGLDEVANPVLRFACSDVYGCEEWHHRIRAAIAKRGVA